MTVDSTDNYMIRLHDLQLSSFSHLLHVPLSAWNTKMHIVRINRLKMPPSIISDGRKGKNKRGNSLWTVQSLCLTGENRIIFPRWQEQGQWYAQHVFFAVIRVQKKDSGQNRLYITVPNEEYYPRSNLGRDTNKQTITGTCLWLF